MHLSKVTSRGVLVLTLGLASLITQFPTPSAAATADLNAKTDCGAVGNGVADDTSALQSCINQAAVSGQAVYLPVGKYRISSTLTISSGNMTVYGTNSTTTSIVQSNAAAHILLISNNGAPVDRVVLRQLELYHSTPQPTGMGIVCNTCWRTYFQQMNFGKADSAAHMTTGLWVTGGNQVFVQNSTFTYGTSQSMYFADVGDVFLSNVEVNMFDDDTQSTGIVFDSGVGGIYAVNVNVTGGNTGFLFESIQPGKVPPNFGFFTNCLADTGNGVGWHFEAGTSMRLTNSWAATYRVYGVLVNNVDGLSITDSRIYNNGSTGIVLNSGAHNVTIKDSTITGNSRLASGTKPGISVAAGVSGFQILDNVIGAADTFGNWQSYGVQIAAGASNEFMIAGNKLRPNVTGGLSNGATGTQTVVANNL